MMQLNKIHLSAVMHATLAGLFWLSLLFAGTAMGLDDSGLDLTVQPDEQHADPKYYLGVDAVKVIITSRNTAGHQLLTTRGSSQAELHHYLIITDPKGTKHILNPSNENHKMPPPFFLQNKAWALAETVSSDWARSVTVDDLRQQVPVMNTLPGWYTVEVQRPYLRFAQSGYDAGLGLLGLLDQPENWTGTVNSNKLQIYITPDRGAKLKIKITEGSGSVLDAVGQVPVRVFKGVGDPDFNPLCDVSGDGVVDQNDLASFSGNFGQTGSSLPGDTDQDGDIDGNDVQAFITSFGTAGIDSTTTWTNSEAIMLGTSDFEGWVVWETNLSCLPEDNYVAIAFHGGEYEQTSIVEGDASGWSVSCDNLIADTINFGVAQTVSGDFNGDDCIDMTDYDMIIAEIDSDPPQDPLYDLNGDGIVTVADARFLVTLFTNPAGAPCP